VKPATEVAREFVDRLPSVFVGRRVDYEFFVRRITRLIRRLRKEAMEEGR